ncbi:MAG: signal peptide peptidase SppA [Polyangiaceae bacterium]|nr:signal peptide peptidase SppA [Polyangiaceae bacterium]MCW5789330.1 signal peptide peptidase SppA [Polyangiaceae bacterium]
MSGARRFGAALALLAVTLSFIGCSRPREEAPAPGGFVPAPSASVSYGKNTVLSFDLGAGAPESTDAGGLFGLPPARTYVGLLSAIRAAREDKKAGAVLVKLGGGGLEFARAEELSREFALVRQAGKPVVCHSHGIGHGDALFVTRACDSTWLSPAGGADTVGIASQVIFMKGLLDKLGVEADFIHMGKYKSFAEQFTRDSPSEEAREALNAVLGSLRGTWLGALKQHRPGLEAVIEDGPFTAKVAKQHRLIDAVGYESEAEEHAKQRGEADQVRAVFGPGASGSGGSGLAALVRSISGANRRSGSAARIAVVPAVGGIAMSSGGIGGGGIAKTTMTKTLRRLAEDDSVKAVVLRVDSPGGSALASDLLWEELKRLGEKKPLIASVGGMAASGGYYMAVAAREIYAERTSIVGSIGVVGGKFAIGGALAQHGIHSEIIAARPGPSAKARAAYLSPFEPWDDATRARMRELMEDTYGLFLKRVAEGRKLSVAQVEPHAGGRIWSGAQGHERKLVDHLGGLRDAIERARSLAGLPDDAPVTVEGGGESLLDVLGGDESASAEQVARAADQLTARRNQWLELVSEALLPHAQAFAPVMEGESRLLVMPYLIQLR